MDNRDVRMRCLLCRGFDVVFCVGFIRVGGLLFDDWVCGDDVARACVSVKEMLWWIRCGMFCVFEKKSQLLSSH